MPLQKIATVYDGDVVSINSRGAFEAPQRTHIHEVASYECAFWSSTYKLVLPHTPHCKPHCICPMNERAYVATHY